MFLDEIGQRLGRIGFPESARCGGSARELLRTVCELDEARCHLARSATPEAEVHRRWNRVSRHPGFFAESRQYVFGPLLRCGALAGSAAVDAWEARQRRGGLPD